MSAPANKEPENPFHSARTKLLEAISKLPGHVTIPYELTPEGDRARSFRRVCPKEFCQKIDPARIQNPEAFAAVAQWDGNFPGPLAVGETDKAKTRAVWSALGRLWVKEGKDFCWFSTKRLTESYFAEHMDGDPDRFWRAMKRFSIIFIDDCDKLEPNPRNDTVLFEFFDWAYRENRPVIATTNRDREWWTGRMGAPFCRRFFDEVHRTVIFT